MNNKASIYPLTAALTVALLTTGCGNDSNDSDPGATAPEISNILVSTTSQSVHSAGGVNTYANVNQLVLCSPDNDNCGKSGPVLYNADETTGSPDNLGPYVTSLVTGSGNLYAGTSTNKILSCGTQTNPTTCTEIDSFGSAVLSLIQYGDSIYAGTAGGIMLSCAIGGTNNCVTLNDFGHGITAFATDNSNYIYAGTSDGTLLQCPAGETNACSTLLTGLGSINSLAFLNGYVYIATQPGKLYMYQVATNTNTTLMSLNSESQVKQLIAVASNVDGNAAVYAVSLSGWLWMTAPGAASGSTLSNSTNDCAFYTGFAYDGSDTFYLLSGINAEVCAYTQSTGTLSTVTSLAYPGQGVPQAIMVF